MQNYHFKQTKGGGALKETNTFSQPESGAQRLGHGETDVLFATGDFLGVKAAQGFEGGDDLLDQLFGGAGAGGDADGGLALEPGRVDLGGVVE